MIRVATANILNDLSRWVERRVVLARGLAELAPDLIALQEVTDPLGASTAHWLAGELGGYRVLVGPKSGWERRREGIAVLSRLPVEGHDLCDLPGQQRIAQFLRVKADGSPILLVNGHYHWPPGLHAVRLRQVRRVLDRLDEVDRETTVIACGDFNGTPGSPAIDLIGGRLVSAHMARHGREPEFTCPTPLRSGRRLRDLATRAMLRLFTNRPGDQWRGTLDYIFVSPDVRVVESGVFLDRPSPDDPTLYASDHLGLTALLEIPPRDDRGGGPSPLASDGSARRPMSNRPDPSANDDPAATR